MEKNYSLEALEYLRLVFQAHDFFDLRSSAKPIKQQDKVRKYVECIRSDNTFDRPKYYLVRIVCEKESVFKALKSATAIFNGYFAIEMASDFFGQWIADSLSEER